jgi:glycosyltransferase involved in cell wall biosynthesis
MKKLLIICPHLSTGGAPQVTANKIELIKDEFIIKVVEHSFISWQHIVQRNKIIKIVGNENFITLRDSDKTAHLGDIIYDFNPDVISLEEIPEFFMSNDMADIVYSKDRNYTITETTHDSSFNHKNKIYFPDKFIFVSPYSAFQYIDLDVPIEIIEYPIDKKYRNQQAKVDLLGLDPQFKHIVIVGLFTPRKNQKYVFELANKLKNYPIKFHFLGNQADNFESYWKPLMEYKREHELDNCIAWGEVSNVIDFIEASDMFLFPSKGDRGNKELNPIAIKEAMQYDIHKLMYNLDVYCNKYNDYDKVDLLSGELQADSQNVIDILDLKVESKREEIIVIGTYPNLKERARLTKECIQRLKPLGRKIMLVSHYPVDEETQLLCDYYIYDAHNPLTHQSYYTRFFNYTNDYDAEININGLKNSNQSLTVLTNLFTAFKAAKSFGFKRLFYTTYDVLVDERDLKEIETSFSAINHFYRAYFGAVNTPFGHGVETTAMTFDIDYFVEVFDDVRDADEYNSICSKLGAQNFLEDYMIKKLKLRGIEDYIIIINEYQTFLQHSGRGVSSNSEYYSILPIVGRENEFMFYFYTYNIDDRRIDFELKEIDKQLHRYYLEISKLREFKQSFKFNGDPITIGLEFYDGDRMYKKESFEINKYNLEKYKNTGHFKYKNIKPKIKLVQLQITKDDERQEKSRESLQRVKDYGWEYVLHTNTPYTDLPPKHNCIRPLCVSLELYAESKVQEVGSALAPAHYGCYEAFKNGILSEFTDDIDFLIVCEGDCIIEVPINEFIEKVEKSCEYVNNNNIGYMSFGDKDTLEHGWRQSNVIEEIPNQQLMYITNHIIGLQCIMFPQLVRKYLKETLLKHKWDAADLYFNIIFANSQYKMGIVHDRLTTQADGISTIDNTYKTFRKL